MRVYIDFLMPLGIIGIIIGVFVNMGGFFIYQQVLLLYGLCVPMIWGPCYARYWERRYTQMKHKWAGTGSTDDYNVETLNPHYLFVMRRNHRTGDQERVNIYEGTWYYWKLYLAVGVVSFICIGIMTYGVTAFVAWWLFLVEAPSCEQCEQKGWDCTYGLSCFDGISGPIGTLRWTMPVSRFRSTAAQSHFSRLKRPAFSHSRGPGFSFPRILLLHFPIASPDRILIQGISLGISIDILLTEFFVWFCRKITDYENVPTVEKYHKKVIYKQAAFIWLGHVHPYIVHPPSSRFFYNSIMVRLH